MNNVHGWLPRPTRFIFMPPRLISPANSFTFGEYQVCRSIVMSDEAALKQHHVPQDFSDRFALGFTKSARFFADTFFAKRYGHRAVVLETVAAVPGMVDPYPAG
jgi:hypothetical protein